MKEARRERIRVQKVFEKPSRTKQSFKDECDINKIMKRFKNVAGADYLATFNECVSGHFGDVSDIPDYRAARDQIMRAEALFEALPSIVRKRFDNDPAAFVDFCSNPANQDELIKLGLANPKQDVVDSGRPESSVSQGVS